MQSKTDFETELARNGYIVYTNTGTSMMPMLRQHSDLIVIHARPEGRLKKYDVILFRRDEKYVLHRIIKVRKNDYLVCGDNQFRPEYVSDSQIIGVLTSYVREGREIPVTDSEYLKYVHRTCDAFRLRCLVLYAKYMKARLAHKIHEKRNR